MSANSASQKEIDQKRAIWVENRLLSYLNARYATNRAYWFSAFVLAAYAVEFSLKQLIHEHCNYDDSKVKSLQLDSPRNGINSHNLEAIYENLVHQQIIDDILSRKFLAKLTFESKRYPAHKIKAYNEAQTRQDNLGPLLMPSLDSVIAKIDYFMISRLSLGAKGSIFMRALSSGYYENYFAFNIHAYHRFDKYVGLFGDSYVRIGDTSCVLSDLKPKELFENETGDIRRNSEPFIPSLYENIDKYDENVLT